MSALVSIGRHMSDLLCYNQSLAAVQLITSHLVAVFWSRIDMNIFLPALWRLFKSPLLTLTLLASASAMAANGDEWLYKVRPGDTLSHIAQKHLDRTVLWKALQKRNKVGNPKLLQPGSTLRIPYALSTQSTSLAEVVSFDPSP
jgi:LysM repeat protein